MPHGTTTYEVEGMTCGHCVQAVTEEVSAVPGVEDVDVDLTTGTVAVTGRDVDEAAVRAAVDEAGYDVRRAG
jgi:copper chaperone